MLRLAGERDELRIVNDQHGAPTWADWLAEATTSLLEARIEKDASNPFGEVSGIYHLTNAGETTWCDFAQAIFKRASAF